MKTINQLLRNRELSENEIKKCAELVALINEFGQKVFKKDNFVDIITNLNAGYSNDYGYYIINESKAFTKELLLCGESVDEAFQRTIHEVVMKFAIEYEIVHHYDLFYDFRESYKSKYMNYNMRLSYDNYLMDARRVYYNNMIHSVVNYLMEAWCVYYEANIPENVIIFYEDYLQHFVNDDITYEWKYNQTTNTFERVVSTQRLLKK